MAAILNGIVASIIIIGGVIAGTISESVGSNFELFFCLSWITLLISYVPMFLAFLKLRRVDKRERVYRVPGGMVIATIFAFVPFIILILGIVFTIFGDFTVAYLKDNLPLIIGVVLSFIVEEILVFRIKKDEVKPLDDEVVGASKKEVKEEKDEKEEEETKEEE